MGPSTATPKFILLMLASGVVALALALFGMRAAAAVTTLVGVGLFGMHRRVANAERLAALDRHVTRMLFDEDGTGESAFSRVTVIRSVADWERLLHEPRALLFLWFQWSVPVVPVLRRVLLWRRDWARHCTCPPVPLYTFDGDALPEFKQWNAEVLHESGGWGSLFLFNGGRVAEQFYRVDKVSLGRLSRACDEHFQDHDMHAATHGTSDTPNRTG